MHYEGENRTYRSNLTGEDSQVPIVVVSGKADHVVIPLETMDLLMTRFGWKVV